MSTEAAKTIGVFYMQRQPQNNNECSVSTRQLTLQAVFSLSLMSLHMYTVESVWRKPSRTQCATGNWQTVRCTGLYNYIQFIGKEERTLKKLGAF